MSLQRTEVKRVTYKCPVCGKTHEMPMRQYMAEEVYNGETVQYLRTAYYCSNKEEEFTPSDILEQNLSHIVHAYNRKKGLEEEGRPETLLCANCRKKVTYRIKRRSAASLIGDVEIPYEESYGICDECHEELFVPGLDDQNEKLIEELYRSEKGLVTVSEIQDILSELDLSPEEFTQVLELPTGTIENYLNGQLPKKDVSDKIRKFGKR